MRNLLKCSSVSVTVFFAFVSSALGAAYPQVEIVKKVMPAVVGIGIEKSGYGSYRFSGSEFMEEFKKFYQKEEEDFKKKSAPQWDKDKDKIAADEIVAIGSGFFTDKSGKVVTNYHVIEGQRNVFVMTKDNKIYKTRVVNSSREDDLAILEIVEAQKDFLFIRLGNSDTLEVAEPVIAIGNPFGFTFTVTSGIISAVGRTTPDGREGLIQTDAAVNPGNSGGPLINMDGEVIGINCMIYTSKGGGFMGVAFAVPVNRAKALLASAPGEKGGAYLGVRLTGSSGFVTVDSVEEGSPADRAGLKGGEIILSVDGRDLKNPGELSRYIQSKRPGDKVILKVRDKDRVVQLEVTLDRAKE